jgi:hypothetical protein
MNDVERQVLESLRELDAMAKAMPAAHPKPNLIPVFDKLDQLTARLGPGADHSLLHYLHKKSYEKALRYLEGRENAQGSCRH